MSLDSEHIQQQIDELYRAESRRVFASLVRVLRDFDLAEEALHEAFASAIMQWPKNGVPQNPRAWLVSAGKFKAIDTLRRRGKFDGRKQELVNCLQNVAQTNAERSAEEIEDDRLRLIFTCCHPAIAPSVQVALTLREVCGLTTEEIARAFLVNPTTMAQRIVRGKTKIRDACIPFVIPREAEANARLESVLAVIYLVFNEGYSASSGETLTRTDLSGEAIRLGRLLVDLLPDPEAIGLLALMLLQESRRAARSNNNGEIILLEDQNRSLWNAPFITEGQKLVQRALLTRRFGSYTIQAAIAAVHASAQTAASTDWQQILALYDALYSVHPSPVVELNRAVASAMLLGPAVGLEQVEAILSRGDLIHYHLAYAAQADFFFRLKKYTQARSAYEHALSLTQQAPERNFLFKRLAELDSLDYPSDE